MTVSPMKTLSGLEIPVSQFHQNLSEESSTSLLVHVITPRGIIWNRPVESVILPSITGEMGILKGHVALLTPLDIGVMTIRANGKWIPIYLMGGFAQVEGDEVTVLVNGAERGDEIDPQLAQIGVQEAERLLKMAQDKSEKLKAKQALKKARSRLKAAIKVNSVDR